MLAQRNAKAAYRSVDFDARVAVASPSELVDLCYEALAAALARALLAEERHDNRMKSEALTRAVSTLTALQMGVTGGDGVSAALHQMYTSARSTLLGCVLHFDAALVSRIRQDFIDIAVALAASISAPPQIDVTHAFKNIRPTSVP